MAHNPTSVVDVYLHEPAPQQVRVCAYVSLKWRPEGPARPFAGLRLSAARVPHQLLADPQTYYRWIELGELF